MYCPDDDAVAEGCWESRYQRVWDNSTASILPVSEATAKREQLQGKGVSFIFKSHDLAVIARVSSQIAILEHGSLRKIGDRDAVLTTPTHPYTRCLLEASSNM